MNTVIQENSSDLKNVVVLFASPKKRGATAKLLNEVLDKLSLSNERITHINMYAQNIKPCIDCKMCLGNDCAFNYDDDMQKVVSIISKADIVFIASPIYFNSFPTVLKAFIDRLNQFYVKRFVLKEESPFTTKPGYLVTTLGSNDSDDYVSNFVKKQAEMVFACLNISLVKHFNKSGTDN